MQASVGNVAFGRGAGSIAVAPVFPVHLVTESPRQTSHEGLPEPRTSPGLDRDPAGLEELDLGLEMMGLVPPRPVGPGTATEAKSGARTGRYYGRPSRRDWSWGQRRSCISRLPPGSGKQVIKSSPLESGPAGPARIKAINRNAKRLFVYILDVSATLAQNQVVIDLARRQRKTTGEWGPLRPWYYAPHAAHVKYDPEDRLMLALLDEAQGAAPQAGYTSPSSGGGSGVPPGLTSGPKSN